MKIPKGSGQVERLPPGVDLDHGTKGRPVAFENRQHDQMPPIVRSETGDWRGRIETGCNASPNGQ